MKKLLCTSSAALALAMLATAAQAVPMLSFAPANGSVALGATASVDVMLGDLDGDFIGAYDFHVDWDPTLLSLQDLTFGSQLDGPDNSIFGYVAGTGSVNAFEVSLGGLALQDGVTSFRLFTLSFDTLAVGTSALEFRPGVAGAGASIGDALGNARAAFTTSGALTVTPPPPDPVAVPEPGTLGLLGLAIAFMGFTRRRPLAA
jgi:hypothetical protein